MTTERITSLVRPARDQWTQWRSPAACGGVCLLCSIGLRGGGDRSQHTPLGQALDQAGMDIVVGDQAATRQLVAVLGNVSLGSVALGVILLVATAVLRHRYAAAAAAAAS